MFTLHGQTLCWSVSKDSNGWGINLNKEVGVVHHMKWEQWLSFSLDKFVYIWHNAAIDKAAYWLYAIMALFNISFMTWKIWLW